MPIISARDNENSRYEGNAKKTNKKQQQQNKDREEQGVLKLQ